MRVLLRGLLTVRGSAGELGLDGSGEHQPSARHLRRCRAASCRLRERQFLSHSRAHVRALHEKGLSVVSGVGNLRETPRPASFTHRFCSHWWGVACEDSDPFVSLRPMASMPVSRCGSGCSRPGVGRRSCRRRACGPRRCGRPGRSPRRMHPRTPRSPRISSFSFGSRRITCSSVAVRPR